MTRSCASIGRTASDQRPTLLFRRDFRGLTGGHLKVWHYFRHALGSTRYRPAIHFTPASVQYASNPWHQGGPPVSCRWDPGAAGALFVAGLDWEAVPPSTEIPVFNLIQGLGHAVAGDPRRRFLSRRAVRLCVSPEVADAILATGEVNGPVFTIPAGLETAGMPAPAERRDIDLVVGGFKNRPLGRAIADHFARSGLRVEFRQQWIPREEYLSLFGRAEVVIPIPLAAEGFFLPALEAMAMGAIVVCPDCVGNRSFCRDGVTCLRPAQRPDAILAAVQAALDMPPASRAAIRTAAALEVRRHSLEREREAFLAVLDGISPG